MVLAVRGSQGTLLATTSRLAARVRIGAYGNGDSFSSAPRGWLRLLLAQTGGPVACTSSLPISHARHASSKSASSSRYMARQRRDPYVKARLGSGQGDGSAEGAAGVYVARSAFKLKQLDSSPASRGSRGFGPGSARRPKQSGHILQPGSLVVDLGAAPGGWTQLALESGCAHVFALDLLPLDRRVEQGVAGSASSRSRTGGSRLTFLQGDMRTPEIHAELRRCIVGQRQASKDSAAYDTKASLEDARVDVVLSDMMANTSGNPVRDSQASLDLLETAFAFAKQMLRPSKRSSDGRKMRAARVDNDAITAAAEKPNGASPPVTPPASTLVLKYFASPEADTFRRDVLVPAFRRVACIKVAASRSESSEMYFVCRDLRHPEAQVPAASRDQNKSETAELDQRKSDRREDGESSPATSLF